MASDDKSGGKPRAKPPRKKRAKPSFTPTPADHAQAGWAYRSDAPAPAPPAVPADAPEATPVARRAAPAARPKALAPSRAATLLPPTSHRPNVLENALDALAVPIGIVLMAVLAPVSEVLAPRKKP